MGSTSRGATLITRHSGQHVLNGAALSLAATTQTWAEQTDTPLHQLVHTAAR